jgi:tetratricopeptide (TPR) repeat protein
MSSGGLKSSSVQVILFGVFGMLSISSLLYFYFLWRRDNTLIKRITPSSSSSPSSENNDDKANKKDDIKEEIIVEDVEDDDDDDDDDDEEEEVESEEVDEAKANEEKEALRLKYDNANRIAMKYISGQAYEKAIEKLTEALELACIIPNANKDILTLYNNRSAMYEKNNNYDKALTDISVILAIEFNHLKARVSDMLCFIFITSIIHHMMFNHIHINSHIRHSHLTWLVTIHIT